MTIWAMLLAVIAAPFIALPLINTRWMWHARSLFVVGLLVVGAVWLAPHELWLSLIACWFLWRWPLQTEPHALLPSLVMWVAVGAAWFLLRDARVILVYAPRGWLVAAWFQSGLVAYRWWTRGGRQKGTLGSPVATAILLALVAPFCPWWGWPVLAVGLALTCSWLALAGVAVGMAVLYPAWVPLGASVVAVVAILAGVLEVAHRRGWDASKWVPSSTSRSLWQALLEDWTPRGGSIPDTVWSRWYTIRLILANLTWKGHGPETMRMDTMRWTSRYGVMLPHGEAMCDPAQMLHEYGLTGGLAMAAFLWRVLPGLSLGDAWSAAWVVGVVASLAWFPARHIASGVLWLAVSARIAP